MRGLVVALYWMLFGSVVHAAAFAHDTVTMEDLWASAKYEMTEEGPRLAAVERLLDQAEVWATHDPGKPEPLVWQALAHILEAEIRSNLSSLPALDIARQKLEEALALDPQAMGGAIYVNLGTLYYRVPGWPLSFGDNRRAAAHLSTALAIDPEGRDSNYFYGDFLLQTGRAREAMPFLEKALRVPIRPDHARADRGRHGEVLNTYRTAERRRTR